jgi:hypothetical protein
MSRLEVVLEQVPGSQVSDQEKSSAFRGFWCDLVDRIRYAKRTIHEIARIGTK